MKKSDIQNFYHQNQEKEPLILDIRKKATELLSNSEVDTISKKIDANIHYINGTIPNNTNNLEQKQLPFEEKLSRFIDQDNPENFLPKFWQQMDSEKSDITDEEGIQLDELNNQLLQSSELVTQLIAVLIDTQRQNLLQRNVDPKVIEIEIQHIKDVVAYTQSIFPNLPILHLAASVHDSYKHVEKNYNELGLHELTSTAFGGALVNTMLNKYKQKLDLNPEKISLINKLVMRAIFTHGTNEYPRNNTVYSKKHPQIGALHGNDVHIKPRRNSYDESENPSKTVRHTILGINYIDALTGTDANSLIKYNLASQSEKIAQHTSVADYFFVRIFNAFESNINMPAGKILRNLKNQNLDNLISKNREVKNLLEWSLKHKNWRIRLKYGKEFSEKIKENRNHLILQFKKLQKEVEKGSLEPNSNKVKIQQQREKFNTAVQTFINYAAATVTTSHQK